MKEGSREASWNLWEGSKGEEGTKVASDVSSKLCLWEAAPSHPFAARPREKQVSQPPSDAGWHKTFHADGGPEGKQGVMDHRGADVPSDSDNQAVSQIVFQNMHLHFY